MLVARVIMARVIVPLMPMIVPGVGIGHGVCRCSVIVSGVRVTRSVGMAVVLTFDYPNGDGDGESGEEGGGENSPVVGVKMKFGQQVAHGDAHEGSGRESQSIGQHVAFAVSLAESQVEDQHACWDHEGEENVDDVPRGSRPAAHGHERADRH